MNHMLKVFINKKNIGSISAHSYIDNFSYKKILIFIFLNDIQVGVGVRGQVFEKK